MREGFSKETVEIRKKLLDQVKMLREDGKYAVIKHDKVVARDFRPRRSFPELWLISQANYYFI